MKIFLTGGSGFIGKVFIKEALKRKHFIYAITRKIMKKKKTKNLTWLKGEIDKDWSKYLKKSDVLVHMAQQALIIKQVLKKLLKLTL